MDSPWKSGPKNFPLYPLPYQPKVFEKCIFSFGGAGKKKIMGEKQMRWWGVRGEMGIWTGSDNGLGEKVGEGGKSKMGRPLGRERVSFYWLFFPKVDVLIKSIFCGTRSLFFMHLIHSLYSWPIANWSPVLRWSVLLSIWHIRSDIVSSTEWWNDIG